MKFSVRTFLGRKNGIILPIATKLILIFLLIIVIISAVFMLVGTRLISDRIVSEAQEKVRNDLNAAREIYLSDLVQLDNVVQLTAERFFLRDALSSGTFTDESATELTRIQEEEELDVLSITDKFGYVLLRTSNPDASGDNQGHDDIVQAVMHRKEPLASTIIVSGDDLQKESPGLAEQAYFKFIDTPLARQREEFEETSGMMLKSAAPVFDKKGELVGVVYGAVLLNRNFEIVDKVKQTVYEDVIYKGQAIGTATIFQDDFRISTNVRNEDGSRALGTRVSEEVYNQVVIKGEPWIGRAFVVNNWYITAYEPIRDVYNRIIGILYVGLLEQKYLDIREQTVFTFSAITLVGALVSLAASYFVAQRILVPINQLVTASKSVAKGDLSARVNIKTNDELQYLAESFNAMATSLEKRDEQLKEFATRKIMESERLALIGQLSANVAHELNNPLQGIVAYSHLLLEQLPDDYPSKNFVEKIVGQANRSRDIIRGLLDFSRQRTPDITLCDINGILVECVSLLENQALFLNIEVFKDLSNNLPLTVLDPSQIERVFINIIINAAEAMDGNGELQITSHYDHVNNFIEVEFKDNGGGIREEDINHIFDPFFTTKDVGHGTGLGLAISYGIVKRHNGFISVNSTVGKGSTFIVGLPVIETQQNDRIKKVSVDGRNS